MTQNVNAINIKWHELFKPIEGLRADSKNHLIVEREVIPIIFVPGIMGSRLKNAEGDKVWDPDDPMFMVGKYGLKSATPEKRKSLLIGNTFNSKYATVINDDSKHNSKKFGKYKSADKRGWGGVSWSSYGDFLEKLDKHKFSDPIQQCFEFPVHAFGYNWTGSNKDSGFLLNKYIDKTIQEYKKNGRICEKVILVTHSMGGLVARSACVLHGAESKVLGVLHGVQPATGSPAAYWRMKAGWERPEGGPTDTLWDWIFHPIDMTKRKISGTIAAWVLGTNGVEVTSLLANMPGGLELLPNKDYTDNDGNKQWLSFVEPNGVERKLPESDPYTEIYLAKDVFYRLVDPNWLGKESKKKKPSSLSKWGEYEVNLDLAVQFHDQLKIGVHDETYQFYSEGIKSADKIEFEHERYYFGDIETRGAFQGFVDGQANVTNVDEQLLYISDYEEFQDLQFYGDLKTDTEKVNIWLYSMKYPSGSGDGTVPMSSATSLSVGVSGYEDNEEVDAFGETVESTNSNPDGNATISISTKDGESWFKIGHEPIYKTKTAQTISFSAIENFGLQKINEYL